MGQDSRIEWTHNTFNPWWGCVKVSPGCANCYAETFSKRYGHNVWGKDAERRFFGDKHWNEPLKWNKTAADAGVRRRVFCSSMADVFERHADTAVDAQMGVARTRLFNLILLTPNLDWLLLTKRPENIIPMLREIPAFKRDNVYDHLIVGHDGKAWTRHFPNLWFGTSVENQEQAEKRIPELLKVPAAVRFCRVSRCLGRSTYRLLCKDAPNAMRHRLKASLRMAAGATTVANGNTTTATQLGILRPSDTTILFTG